ncbi:MAG: hypothetical protein KKF62_05065 [Bacteroidetes bacterium]|nr:hypothetical protein [Bacteroidota bacterium]MBU1114298.1 hypothetical protein [Bacteroidota bacterium]MBU1799413.1 hypothetical protein [Bacteroidota bacterium]
MKTKLLIPIFLFFFLATSISAQDYAAAVKVSSLGFSGEVIRSFGEQFNVRAGFAFFSISLDGGGGTEDYTYTADAKLSSFSALVDYFPFGGIFRISGGALVNLNNATTILTPTKTYTIGNDEYTPEKLGNLDAKIDFDPVAPYIGIGWGNPTAGVSGLSVTFDIGTMYQGAPSVDLTAKGLLEPSASQDQEDLITSNLDWFKWYPIISLGLNYKF